MKWCWEIWCKALGSKAFEDDARSDYVAMIRTFWVSMHVITCFFIIASAGRNLGLW